MMMFEIIYKNNNLKDLICLKEEDHLKHHYLRKRKLLEQCPDSFFVCWTLKVTTRSIIELLLYTVGARLKYE
jgi:hypothetical protein